MHLVKSDTQFSHAKTYTTEAHTRSPVRRTVCRPPKEQQDTWVVCNYRRLQGLPNAMEISIHSRHNYEQSQLVNSSYYCNTGGGRRGSSIGLYTQVGLVWVAWRFPSALATSVPSEWLQTTDGSNRLLLPERVEMLLFIRRNINFTWTKLNLTELQNVFNSIIQYSILVFVSCDFYV